MQDRSRAIQQLAKSLDDDVDPRAVRDQLDRLLSSPHFRNSKRYPALLRYAVERALEGKAADLKERTIAADVFGRSPDYDTSVDPVVRISAAEVRKRLAQYYQELDHAGELRIELPVGSYIPEFQKPAPRHSAEAVETVALREPARRLPVRLVSVAAVAFFLLGAVVWTRWRPQPSELDRFWSPVVSPGGSVMVCVGSAGVPARLVDTTGAGVARGGRISWPDTLTMARLTGFLQAKGLAVQFCREEQATFSDFQAMPAVLIGGLNDEWALRLMENMRFQFRREGSLFWISDRNRPEFRDWSIDVGNLADPGRLALKRDYAVVSRVHNSRTGKITVTVAGLWGSGTVAGGKFLTEPAFLREAVAKLPPDWSARNVQFVLGAEVIEGNPGPPRVLASVVW